MQNKHIAGAAEEMHWPHKFAILALDNGKDPLVQQKFKGVMHSLDAKYKPLLGKWNGVCEPSWLVPSSAIEALGDAGLIEQQEAILFVSECNKMYCTMLYTANGNTEPAGNLCEVPQESIGPDDGYTYDTMTGVYYVCKHMTNPDSVPPDAGWPTPTRTAQIKDYLAALDAIKYAPPSLMTTMHLRSAREFLSSYFGVTL